ncbi:MAG: xanthine dehydrogenase accessory factor [Chlamydiales bacterium]
MAGGGHVGLALSKVMASLDFHVTVFDHRPEVKTILENSYAHEIIITDFEEIGKIVAEGDNAYVAIVSTNFKTDEAALRALVSKKLRYLGIMGSAAKLEHLFGILRNEGYSNETLRKIHAPIGVSIYSRSVEEIGISIAAELVQAKNS